MFVLILFRFYVYVFKIKVYIGSIVILVEVYNVEIIFFFNIKVQLIYRQNNLFDFFFMFVVRKVYDLIYL